MANNLTSSAVFDMLSLFGIPTTTIQNLWQQHCEQKVSESRDILFDEIEQGCLDNMGEDDKVSIMHRYMQAAMNGSARINLRLLAKAINNLKKGKKLSNPIYANEFNRYAQALETLSYEEIKVLAQLYDMREQQKKYIKENNAPMPGIRGNYAERFCINLEYMRSDVREKTIALLCSLLRTGLVYQDGIGALNSIQYILSPFFDEIIKLVDFQDALNKENNQDSKG